MSVPYCLRLDLMPCCRHSQISGLRQDFHSPGNLLVVGSDRHAFSRHSTVSGSDDVEAQLKFNKRAIMIYQRSQAFEGWIARDKILKGFKDGI